MQPGYPSQPPNIDNNMTMSIVSLFVFWPLAIPALINASKVNPALQQGDYHGAQHAATESRKWSKMALIVGAIWYGLALICCVLAVALGAFSAGGTSTY